MSRIVSGNYQFTIRSDFLSKIIQDLKDVFSLIYQNIYIIENEWGDIQKVEKAWNILQKVIERNQDLFERVS